jgi:hypothetical protein
MSHICANDEYRFQVGATNRPENIVIEFESSSRLSLRLRADISKVTAHEKIQHLYFVEGGTKLSGQFLKEATV